jgi:putative transposase
VSEYLRRTAITRLRLTDEQRRLVESTIDEWREAATIACDIGWRCGESAKTTLQSMAYEEVREETELGSQHAVLATHQAAEALAGVETRREDGKSVSKPSFTAPTITYDSRSMTVFEDDETVSLLTVDGRIRCDMVLPEADDGYQYQYFGEEWAVTESTLTVRDGEYHLHLGYRKPAPDDEVDEAEDRTVLGVDLGIENLVVTSTARFVSGRRLRHEHREFERVRGNLQQTGTESAHRTMVERGGRERRYVRDVLHRAANAVVDEATQHDVDVIALEALEGIRERLPNTKQFHQWAHRRLAAFVEYKARALGIECVYVDPAYTSQRCVECGHTARANRRSRNEFACTECGATANADYVAAKNVGLRYVRRGPQSSRRTGERRLALKSGTVNPAPSTG